MMKVVRRLGSKVSLISKIRSFPAYMADPEVALAKKGAVALGLFYGIWPMDAVPDVVPVIGWLDDVGILWLLYLFMMRELGQYIRRRKESSGQPASSRITGRASGHA